MWKDIITSLSFMYFLFSNLLLFSLTNSFYISYFFCDYFFIFFYCSIFENSFLSVKVRFSDAGEAGSVAWTTKLNLLYFSLSVEFYFYSLWINSFWLSRGVVVWSFLFLLEDFYASKLIASLVISDSYMLYTKFFLAFYINTFDSTTSTCSYFLLFR